MQDSLRLAASPLTESDEACTENGSWACCTGGPGDLRPFSNELISMSGILRPALLIERTEENGNPVI